MPGRAAVHIVGPAPTVQRLHTDLAPDQAADLSVVAHTSAVFDERSTTTKTVLMTVWAAAAVSALDWLWRHSRKQSGDRGADLVNDGTAEERESSRTGATRDGRRAAGVIADVAMAVVLAGWAVIGPLSDDDGFAAMIARNSPAAGFDGNYYRWWNASETPFALAPRSARGWPESTRVAVASSAAHRRVFPGVLVAVQPRRPTRGLRGNGSDGRAGVV